MKRIIYVTTILIVMLLVFTKPDALKSTLNAMTTGFREYWLKLVNAK